MSSIGRTALLRLGPLTGRRCRTCAGGLGRSLPARGMAKANVVLPRKQRSEKDMAKEFVDFKQMRVTGGDGGNGCLSFMSLPFKEWAGPDGGDGGNGAHVVFQASSQMSSLTHTKSLYRGEHGANGRTTHRHGKNAAHSYIQVPLGSMFSTPDGSLLADLAAEGDIFVAARGGAGGHGNHFFLTNELRAPMIYEEGAKGEDRHIAVELRVIADAGLVGFPNAGKSTLLRAISRATPKVASYAFTTLSPHVGVVEYDDYEQIAVADLPGLIRDAHLDRGLGTAFLRHIERCRCLLYVVDVADSAPWLRLTELRAELDGHSPGLGSRRHAVVANKVDVSAAAAATADELRRRVAPTPVFAVSAKRRHGLAPLLAHLRRMCDDGDDDDDVEDDDNVS